MQKIVLQRVNPNNSLTERNNHYHTAAQLATHTFRAAVLKNVKENRLHL